MTEDKRKKTLLGLLVVLFAVVFFFFVAPAPLHTSDWIYFGIIPATLFHWFAAHMAFVGLTAILAFKVDLYEWIREEDVNALIRAQEAEARRHMHANAEKT